MPIYLHLLFVISFELAWPAFNQWQNAVFCRFSFVIVHYCETKSAFCGILFSQISVEKTLHFLCGDLMFLRLLSLLCDFFFFFPLHFPYFFVFPHFYVCSGLNFCSWVVLLVMTIYLHWSGYSVINTLRQMEQTFFNLFSKFYAKPVQNFKATLPRELFYFFRKVSFNYFLS